MLISVSNTCIISFFGLPVASYNYKIVIVHFLSPYNVGVDYAAKNWLKRCELITYMYILTVSAE